jgi:hypothetical protein
MTTDSEYCAAFLARYGDRILYVASERTWFLFDGQRWTRDDTGAVTDAIHQFTKLTSATRVRAVEFLVRCDRRVAVSLPELRAIANGMPRLPSPALLGAA